MAPHKLPPLSLVLINRKNQSYALKAIEFKDSEEKVRIWDKNKLSLQFSQCVLYDLHIFLNDDIS